jgi:hypothetical protein
MHKNIFERRKSFVKTNIHPSKCPNSPKKELWNSSKSFQTISTPTNGTSALYKEKFVTNGHTFILTCDREPTQNQLWLWWQGIHDFFQ